MESLVPCQHLLRPLEILEKYVLDWTAGLQARGSCAAKLTRNPQSQRAVSAMGCLSRTGSYWYEIGVKEKWAHFQCL